MVRGSRFEFPNRGATAMLAGRLDAPEGEIKAFALFAHCFACSKDILAAGRIAGALAARGIAVLRFDFTGLGGSEGDFANTNFSSNIADFVAAADFLRQYHRAPQLLIGHSLGGAAVLAAAGDIPEIKAVATIGAPSDPSHVTHLFKSQTGDIVEQGAARVQLAGREFTIKKQFIEDIARHRLADKIAALRKALLVLHGPLDQTVGIENASWIFAAAKHPKSFISLDGADHLLSRPSDAAYAADVIAAWAGRYIDHDGGETVVVAPPPARHGVMVEELGSGPYTQKVNARGHTVMADEPISRGGQDKGLSPHEFILAGLGACSSITLRIYAERKGWALGRISVGLDLSRRPSATPGDSAKVDVIEKVITVAGATTDEQRQKLLEIADKCPMHRLLMAQGKVIETRFAGDLS